MYSEGVGWGRGKRSQRIRRDPKFCVIVGSESAIGIVGMANHHRELQAQTGNLSQRPQLGIPRGADRELIIRNGHTILTKDMETCVQIGDLDFKINQRMSFFIVLAQYN